MSVQNLFFARPAPQKAITASIFNNWLWKKVSKCSPSSIFRIFHTSGLLFPPESEIRAGKLLVDPEHLQEDLVGGRPHHRYIVIGGGWKPVITQYVWDGQGLKDPCLSLVGDGGIIFIQQI
jgi:hypothetical protein